MQWIFLYPQWDWSWHVRSTLWDTAWRSSGPRGSWSTSWCRLTSLELGTVELDECGRKATCRWLMQGQFGCFCSQAFLGREGGLAYMDLADVYLWTLVPTREKLMGWSHLVGYLCACCENTLVEHLGQILSFLPQPSPREFMRHDMQSLPHERINQFSGTGSGKWGPSWNKSHSEYDCWLNWGFGW